MKPTTPNEDTSTSDLDMSNMPDAVEPSTSTKPSGESMPSQPTADVDEVAKPSSGPVSSSQPKSASVEPVQSQPAASQPQPATATPVAAANSQPFAQPKSSKKGIIIGSIIAAVAAVGLIGGGVGAYVWYQNPDKVLDDALVHALTNRKSTYDTKMDISGTGSSEGSMSANYQSTTDGKKSVLTYDVSADISGAKVKLDGGAYYEVGGDYYLKVNGINKLLDEYMAAQGVSRNEMPASVVDIINKVDNKWISISEDDLKDLTNGDDEAVKIKQCFDKTATNMERDSSYIREVATLYQKNRFILVDKSLGTRDGAVGYELKGDESRAKDFVKGLKDTKIVREYRDCLPSGQRADFDKIFEDTSSRSAESSSSAKLEVWIDQWSHQLRSAKVTDSSSSVKTTIEMTVKPFDASKLVKPQEDTTARELKDDVEKLMQSYQSSLNSYESSTFNSF